jgi:CRISPR-associated protein Csx14
MTAPAPTISIPVDITNPGQFFACCGLLELTHRFYSTAEGWFTHDEEGDQFHLVAGAEPITLKGILEKLLDAPEFKAILADTGKARMRPGKKPEAAPEIAPPNNDRSVTAGKTNPLQLSGDVRLRLDWWIDSTRRGRTDDDSATTPFKLWAGQQTSRGIVQVLVKEVKKSLQEDRTDQLRRRTPLSGRFGFDPSAAWVALDVGWSPNEQGVDVGTAAAIELLAAIGLQRFRPRRAPTGQFEYLYATWSVPLSPVVAHAACAGACPTPGARTFRFAIVKRGSYKGFEHATETEMTR